MPHHLFVYGSLLFEEVWNRVVHGTYPRLAATLDGYRRVALRGRTYPGLIRDPGAMVEGLACLSLSDGDLRRLIDFEGDEYDRATVRVTLTDGRSLGATVFLYSPRHAHRLTDEPWDPKRFQPKGFA